MEEKAPIYGPVHGRGGHDYNMAWKGRRARAAGGTPLHWAAALPQVDALSALLQRAPSADVTTFSGATPLHIAAEVGSLAAVKLLLSRNANAAAGTILHLKAQNRIMKGVV